MLFNKIAELKIATCKGSGDLYKDHKIHDPTKSNVKKSIGFVPGKENKPPIALRGPGGGMAAKTVFTDASQKKQEELQNAHNQVFN